MNKTQPNTMSVARFVAEIEDSTRRSDFKAVLAIMARCTSKAPKMWGSSIVGFDLYYYKYASGREGSFLIVGASPRKANLVLYIMPGYDHNQAILDRLGKYKIGKSCLYLKKLDDIDLAVLEELIRDSVAKMRANYPTGEAAMALVEAASAKVGKARASQKKAKPSAPKKKKSTRSASKKASKKASTRGASKSASTKKRAAKKAIARSTSKKAATKKRVAKKMNARSASKNALAKKKAAKKSSTRSSAKKSSAKKKASKRSAAKKKLASRR